MKNFHNIEKSKFRAGEYVGYGGGKVWHIRKSSRSDASWIASNRYDYLEQILAFKLDELSKKLENLNQPD